MKKKIAKILLAFILCIIVLPINKVEAKEAFDILKHDVEMTINENGSIDVKEVMSVQFSEQRHGIYVNIPKHYSFVWEMENGTKEYKEYTFPVSNISVNSGHSYSIEHYNNSVYIQIGSADYYANKNETYSWSYTIHTGDLDLKGQQMVLMNIITDGWDTITNKCNFKMIFPKSFDANKVYTTTLNGEVINGIGEAGGVVVNISENTITGYTTRTVESTEKIVVQVLLENDYFTFDSASKPVMYIVFISTIFAVIAYIVFDKYGRDDPIIQTVETHVPAGISSAEVGVIIDETVNDSDICSLFLDWGRRGIITIQENAFSLTLTKIRDLEDDAKKYERVLFDGVFGNKDVVDTAELEYKFYPTFNKTKAYLTRYFDEAHRTLSTKISKRLQVLFTIISGLPVAVVTAIAFYFINYSVLLSTLIGVAVAIMTSLCCVCGIELFNNRYTFKTGKIILYSILSTILFVIPLVVMFVILNKSNVEFYWGVIMIAAQIVIILCTIFMTKKTPYGAELLGKILGLREFILVAEKDRLEALVEENPYYFYDILPFAYALGLTTIWSEHFRNISFNECEWYHTYGHAPYFNPRDMEYRMNHAMATMGSMPSSQSDGYGGGSSSGGGSSGGFGGSSGGSW